MIDTVTDSPDDTYDSRCEMMLDVTLQTLRSDPDLRLCEGLRLIEATRTAVARMAPQLLDHFELAILPQLREVLMTRFGVTEPEIPTLN